jgi:isopentenyldiphosphate isomerase
MTSAHETPDSAREPAPPGPAAGAGGADADADADAGAGAGAGGNGSDCEGDGEGPLSVHEIIDIVDEDDNVIGTAPRGEAYARGLWHRCSFILARDPSGRIFVHRRTHRKLVFPSLYDIFVGGVVGAGESYDETALREAEEELGVSGLAQPTRLFKFPFAATSGVGNWWSTVYEVRVDGPVRPQPEEVAWHDFITEDELERRLDEWEFVPDGLEAYRRLARWRAEH